MDKLDNLIGCLGVKGVKESYSFQHYQVSLAKAALAAYLPKGKKANGCM